MSNEFKGYSLFNEVKHVRLRTWNRLATFLSIFEDHGKSLAQQYVGQLDDVSKKQINNLRQEIVEKGYGSVRQSIIKSYQLSGENGSEA